MAAGGNFGFNEGFNVSMPFPFMFDSPIGIQAGFRATQTNLSGSILNDEVRNQQFITLGAFHRPVDCGLQFGAAYDWLHEEYWYTADLTQLRLEASLVNRFGHEFGVMGAIRMYEDDQAIEDVALVSRDQYLAFYRRR